MRNPYCTSPKKKTAAAPSRKRRPNQNLGTSEPRNPGTSEPLYFPFGILIRSSATICRLMTSPKMCCIISVLPRLLPLSWSV
jgi:hypothetical protein